MDVLNEKLLIFAMVLTRISAFVLVVPVFSSQSVPVRIKAATALLLTIFFVLIKSPQAPAVDFSIVQITLV
ncbi:MAG: flagellar biosynthetic protein FliR, partial [Phycisphaerae bacterium]